MTGCLSIEPSRSAAERSRFNASWLLPCPGRRARRLHDAGPPPGRPYLSSLGEAIRSDASFWISFSAPLTSPARAIPESAAKGGDASPMGSDSTERRGLRVRVAASVQRCRSRAKRAGMAARRMRREDSPDTPANRREPHRPRASPRRRGRLEVGVGEIVERMKGLIPDAIRSVFVLYATLRPQTSVRVDGLLPQSQTREDVARHVKRVRRRRRDLRVAAGGGEGAARQTSPNRSYG